MRPICGLFALSLALLIGCGKTAPDQKTTPKVERTEAPQTPGMVAAERAYDEGRYTDAVRLYTAELATEEAKFAPSWVQLSALNNELGRALVRAGQYDKALEYYQKALAIRLKKLGADHPDVAISYWIIGVAWGGKKDMAKAKKFIGKGHAILLKQLGPNHPSTERAKAQLDALNK